MTLAFLFVSLLALVLIGTPIALALGLASVATILAVSDDTLASVAVRLFETMQRPTLLAIPFFILSATFLATGGGARRIIRFTTNCVGHWRGGLAMASALACMLFAAVAGSSPASVVAIGSIVIADMVRAGYAKAFAASVICSAGALGFLIPPSVVMVVYAAATDSPIDRLFLAGLIPGIVAGVTLLLGIYVAARITDLPPRPRASAAEILAAGRGALSGPLLVVIILVGVCSGALTLPEAAAVAAVYAFVVALFVDRDLGPLAGRGGDSLIQGAVRALLVLPYALIHRDTLGVLIEAGRVTIMLMFIVVNAMLFAHVLNAEHIPQVIAAWLVAIGVEPWSFLVIVNILLLIAGNFLEPPAILVIAAPILFPIALELGIDPLHLGIVMMVNLELALITPPVGLNLFVAAGVTGLSTAQVLRAALPWLAILLAFLVLVTCLPVVSTFLPDLLYGPPIP